MTEASVGEFGPITTISGDPNDAKKALGNFLYNVKNKGEPSLTTPPSSYSMMQHNSLTPNFYLRFNDQDLMYLGQFTIIRAVYGHNRKMLGLAVPIVTVNNSKRRFKWNEIEVATTVMPDYPTKGIYPRLNSQVSEKEATFKRRVIAFQMIDSSLETERGQQQFMRFLAAIEQCADETIAWEIVNHLLLSQFENIAFNRANKKLNVISLSDYMDEESSHFAILQKTSQGPWRIAKRLSDIEIERDSGKFTFLIMPKDVVAAFPALHENFSNYSESGNPAVTNLKEYTDDPTKIKEKGLSGYTIYSHWVKPGVYDSRRSLEQLLGVAKISQYTHMWPPSFTQSQMMKGDYSSGFRNIQVYDGALKSNVSLNIKDAVENCLRFDGEPNSEESKKCTVREPPNHMSGRGGADLTAYETDHLTYMVDGKPYNVSHYLQIRDEFLSGKSIISHIGAGFIGKMGLDYQKAKNNIEAGMDLIREINNRSVSFEYLAALRQDVIFQRGLKANATNAVIAKGVLIPSEYKPDGGKNTVKDINSTAFAEWKTQADTGGHPLPLFDKIADISTNQGKDNTLVLDVSSKDDKIKELISGNMFVGYANWAGLKELAKASKNTKYAELYIMEDLKIAYNFVKTIEKIFIKLRGFVPDCEFLDNFLSGIFSKNASKETAFVENLIGVTGLSLYFSTFWQLDVLGNERGTAVKRIKEKFDAENTARLAEIDQFGGFSAHKEKNVKDGWAEVQTLFQDGELGFKDDGTSENRVMIFVRRLTFEFLQQLARVVDKIDSSVLIGILGAIAKIDSTQIDTVTNIAKNYPSVFYPGQEKTVTKNIKTIKSEYNRHTSDPGGFKDIYGVDGKEVFKIKGKIPADNAIGGSFLTPFTISPIQLQKLAEIEGGWEALTAFGFTVQGKESRNIPAQLNEIKSMKDKINTLNSVKELQMESNLYRSLIRKDLIEELESSSKYADMLLEITSCYQHQKFLEKVIGGVRMAKSSQRRQEQLFDSMVGSKIQSIKSVSRGFRGYYTKNGIPILEDDVKKRYRDIAVRTEGNVILKACCLSFLMTPVNLSGLKNFIDSDLPVPFGFLFFRSPEFLTWSMAGLVPGPETMFYALGKSGYVPTRNPKDEEVELRYSQQGTPVIKQNKNIAVIPNIAIVKPIRNYGSKIATKNDLSIFNRKTGNFRENKCDFICAVVPYEGRYPNWIDATGSSQAYMSFLSGDKSYENDKPDYSGAGLYNMAWWGRTPYDELSAREMSFLHRDTINSMVTISGEARTAHYNPIEKKFIDRESPGKGQLQGHEGVGQNYDSSLVWPAKESLIFS
jgi:hypothetical protein